MEQQMNTITAFAFGLLLGLIPLVVMLAQRNREIKNLKNGLTKVSDSWYNYTKELEEALWQEWARK